MTLVAFLVGLMVGATGGFILFCVLTSGSRYDRSGP